METRRFGRTGHMSTVAIFGAAAFWELPNLKPTRPWSWSSRTASTISMWLPPTGRPKNRIGPWMRTERQRFFLGCKTYERNQESAWAELNRSLERLQVDRFDLYQAHAVNTMEELDLVTGPGGSLQTLLKAREQGLTTWLGITGHGIDSPRVFLEALHRFDFDTVLFPINFVQYANPEFRKNADELLKTCRARDVGVMIIKSITRQPWGDQPHTRNTWYKPFEEPADIQTAVNFALSQDVTGLCTAGDTQIFPIMLQACENFKPMSAAEQEKLIASAGQYEPLFA